MSTIITGIYILTPINSHEEKSTQSVTLTLLSYEFIDYWRWPETVKKCSSNRFIFRKTCKTHKNS